MSATSFKPGDWVRVVGVPPNLTDEEPMKTRSLFEICVGRFFRIEEIEQAEGLLFLKLDVGRMRGRENYIESSWIEPEFVEAGEPKTEDSGSGPE